MMKIEKSILSFSRGKINFSKVAQYDARSFKKIGYKFPKGKNFLTLYSSLTLKHFISLQDKILFALLWAD